MRAITPRYLFGGSGIEVRGVLLQPGATVQLPGPPNDGRHLPHPYPTIWSHLRGIFNIQMTSWGAGVKNWPDGGLRIVCIWLTSVPNSVIGGEVRAHVPIFVAIWV